MRGKSNKDLRDNRRTKTNHDCIIQKRGTKTTLICRRKKVNTANEQKDDGEITFTVSDSNRSLSMSIDPEKIAALVNDCKAVLESDRMDFEQAYYYLTKNLTEADQMICDMVHNYLCNNSIPVMEEYYALLKWYAENPGDITPSDPELDEDLDFYIYEHAAVACRYMRQLWKVTNDLHTCYDPLLVSITDNTEPEIIDGGLYWRDQSLTISYRPYLDQHQKMAHPWRITIDERLVPYGKRLPVRGRGSNKKISINLSNRDFLGVIAKVPVAQGDKVTSP